MADQQAQFEQMMLALQSPDNELRKQAETVYTQTKNTNGMWLFQALLDLAGTSTNPSAVQISLIELRKILLLKEFTFATFTPEAIEHVKQRELHVMGNTADVQSRTIAAECISHTMTKLHADGTGPGWPDLFTLMISTMANPSAPVTAKAGCTHVFAELDARVIQACLSSHHRQLAGGFAACITTADAALAIAATKSLTGLLKQMATEDCMHYSNIVPQVLAVLADTLNKNDFETAKAIAMQMCDLVENAPEIFRGHTSNLLTGMMQVASTPAVESSTRHMAVEVMLTYCESEPKTIRKVHGFAKALFDLLYGYMANPTYEPNWENIEDSTEEEDLENTTDFDVGATGIDRWASSLKAKHVQQIASATIVQDIRAPEWQKRNAAVNAVTYIIEACAEQFAPQLGQILGFVFPLLQDADIHIRHSATLCLAQCCTDFSPNFQKEFHAQVLPALVGRLSDCPRIQGLAASAINTFFDEALTGVEEEDDKLIATFAANYVQPLCGALIPLMNSTPHNFVKKEVVEALGSLSEACKTHMGPYVEVLTPEFQKVLAVDENQYADETTKKQVIELKCSALQSVTLLAASVRLPAFQAYANPICDFLVNLLNANFSTSDPRSKFVMRAWTCMAECMKGEIAPYLPQIMPRLLSGAGAKCDYEYVADEPGQSLPDAPDGTVHAKIMTPDQGEKVVRLKTAEVEDKSLALSVLRVILDELKGGTLGPYLDDIARVAMECLNFKTLEEVRASAAILVRLTVSEYKNCRPDSITTVVNHVVPQLVELIVLEPSIEVVTELYATVYGILKDGAVGALQEQYVGRCSDVLSSIMRDSLNRRQEVLQQIAQTEEDDEEAHEYLEDEQSGEDELLENCCETAGVMLTRCPSFVQVFVQKYIPLMHNLLTDQMSNGEKKAGLHLLCKFIESRAAPVLPMLQEVATTLMKYTVSDDADLAQASFFGLGHVLQTAPSAQGFDTPGFTASLYAQIGGYFAANKHRNDEYEHCTTNVGNASLKLIEANAGSAEANTLWTAIVPILPFTGDEEEAQEAHEKLLRWIVQGSPALADASIKAAVLAKLKTAEADCLNEETKKQLATM